MIVVSVAAGGSGSRIGRIGSDVEEELGVVVVGIVLVIVNLSGT